MWHPKKNKKIIPCIICSKPTTGTKYCKEHSDEKKKEMMREYYQDKKRKHSDPVVTVISKKIEYPPFAWDEANDKCFG